MAYSKRNLVVDALGEAGLASYVFDMTPDEHADVLRRLEVLMALWAAQGINVGYSFGEAPDADIDADSGLALTSVLPVVQNLGLHVAAMFGKQVSPLQAQSAAQAYAALLKQSVASIDPSRPQRSSVPFGAGNRRAHSMPTFIPADDVSPLRQRGDSGDLTLGD